MGRSVRELNEEELNQLKEDYICKQAEENGERVSYQDLLDSHEIDNEVIYREYADYDFCDEDFWCNVVG